MCICKNGPSFQHYFCLVSVRMHVHNNPSWYLLCSLTTLPTVLSDKVHLTGGVCSETAPITHSPLSMLEQTSPRNGWVSTIGVIYLSCPVIALLFLLLYKTHAGLSSYMWSKICLLRNNVLQKKVLKNVKACTSREKVLIPLELTIKPLLYSVQCVIVLGRQEIREQKRLLYDLLSLLVGAREPQLTILC